MDDLSEDEIIAEEMRLKKIRETPPTLEHINAVKWMIERAVTLGKNKR